MKLLKAIYAYLKSTRRHRKYVRQAGTQLGGIPYWRLLIHDLSKYNPVEFINYAKFYKLSNKEDEQAFVRGWMHHQKRNKHHPEYWTSIGLFDFANGAIDMDETYVREWISDLLGASMEYTGSHDMEEFLSDKVSRWNYTTRVTKERFVSVLREIGYVVEITETEELKYKGKVELL